jgi:hypothetical protein
VADSWLQPYFVIERKVGLHQQGLAAFHDRLDAFAEIRLVLISAISVCLFTENLGGIRKGQHPAAV